MSNYLHSTAAKELPNRNTIGRKEEEILFARITDGEREAAEELVDLTYEMIFASLIRFTGGDRDLASDLTQETYRKAWQNLASFNRRASFSTWLYRIAYTTFLNHVRRPLNIHKPDNREEQNFVEEKEEAVDLKLETKERADRLRLAVMALPEELRFTVSAHFFAELPVREIARLHGITSAAIRKRIRRAIKILSSTLEA